VIRELRDEDIAAAAGLERVLRPPELFLTEAGFRHDLNAWPERARHRMWVAVEGGELVGTAEAFFRLGLVDPGAAKLRVGVRHDRRGRGIGSALYETAADHLLAGGATALYAETLADPAGESFLRARGYEIVSHAHYSVIEPARADLSALGRLEAERRAEGFVLAPLRDLRDRPRELWELDAAATLDIPADSPRAPIPYEDWLTEWFEYPEVDDDGSFAALYRDRPVASALVTSDRQQGRAGNAMTGTLPEFRRRGLARLVKLAALRWAQESGIRSMWTGNDARNAGMLALNDALGYRRFLTSTEHVRRL
jgi:GNAT superfamily N-acetyltransferase